MPTWTRVRDVVTGHTFDIDARVLPHRAGVEPVNDPERWPDIEGPRAQPRPPKPFVGKDGKARAAADTSSAESATPDAPDSPAPDAADTAQPARTTGRSRRSNTTTPADTPADTSKEPTS